MGCVTVVSRVGVETLVRQVRWGLVYRRVVSLVGALRVNVMKRILWEWMGVVHCV